MPKVNTFCAWKSAIKAEYDKLDACLGYLTEDGKERRTVYFTLWDMSNFCEDAKELVEWIKTREGLSSWDNSALDSHHAAAPVHRLQQLV